MVTTAPEQTLVSEANITDLTNGSETAISDPQQYETPDVALHQDIAHGGENRVGGATLAPEQSPQDQAKVEKLMKMIQGMGGENQTPHLEAPTDSPEPVFSETPTSSPVVVEKKNTHWQWNKAEINSFIDKMQAFFGKAFQALTSISKAIAGWIAKP